jgi:tetrahydromethanopterin S-methyltransferase subunit G
MAYARVNERVKEIDERVEHNEGDGDERQRCHHDGAI